VRFNLIAGRVRSDGAIRGFRDRKPLILESELRQAYDAFVHPVISVTQNIFSRLVISLTNQEAYHLESSTEMRVAVFRRSIWILAFAAVAILGFDIALSVHELNAGGSYAFQSHHLKAVDPPVICPTAAARWCQVTGGLPE